MFGKESSTEFQHWSSQSLVKIRITNIAPFPHHHQPQLSSESLEIQDIINISWGFFRSTFKHQMGIHTSKVNQVIGNLQNVPTNIFWSVWGWDGKVFCPYLGHFMGQFGLGVISKVIDHQSIDLNPNDVTNYTFITWLTTARRKININWCLTNIEVNIQCTKSYLKHLPLH